MTIRAKDLERLISEKVGRSVRRAKVMRVHGDAVNVRVAGSAKLLRGLQVIGGTDDIHVGDTVLLREADGQLYAESFKAKSGKRSVSYGGTVVSGGGGTDHPAVTVGASLADVVQLTGQDMTLKEQAVGTVFAGPSSGGSDKPTFRALTAADLPGAYVDPSEDVTITGLWTFDRDPNAPFAVTSGSAVVANLDADKVDGYHGTELAALAENETITGTWDFPATGFTIAGDVSLLRGAANRLDVAGGDSLRIVNGELQIGTSVVLSAPTTTRLDLASGNNLRIVSGQLHFGTDVVLDHNANELLLDSGDSFRQAGGLFDFDAGGTRFLLNITSPANSGAFVLKPGNANQVGQVLEAYTSQAVNLWEVRDSGGNPLIIVTKDGALRSGTFISGYQGWDIAADGTAEFNNVFVRGELHSAVFVKDLIEAHAGTDIIIKSAGVLAEEFTIDAGLSQGQSITDTLVINDPPGGGWLFSTNDIIRIRAEVTGGISDTWIKVTQTATSNEYSCTYWSGSLDTTFYEGSVAIDYGVSGQGGVLITAELNYAPYIDIFTHAGAPWTTTTMKTRLGNLAGVTDTDLNPTGYGLYSDNVFLKGALLAGGGNVLLDSVGIRLKSGVGAANSVNWYYNGFGGTRVAWLFCDSSGGAADVDLTADGVAASIQITADGTGGGYGTSQIEVRAENGSQNITLGAAGGAHVRLEDDIEFTAGSTQWIDISSTGVAMGNNANAATAPLDVQLGTSGRVRVNTNPSAFGIGSSTSAYLQIVGGTDAGGDDAVLLFRDEGTNTDWGIYVDYSDSRKLKINRDGNDLFFIEPDGNVVIGSSGSASARLFVHNHGGNGGSPTRAIRAQVYKNVNQNTTDYDMGFYFYGADYGVQSGYTQSGYMYGAYIVSYVGNSHAGTLTNLCGVRVHIGSHSSAAGAVTTAAGLFVNPVQSGTTSFSTVYGLYIGDMKNLNSGAYGIYVAGGQNYFNGGVDITGGLAVGYSGTVHGAMTVKGGAIWNEHYGLHIKHPDSGGWARGMHWYAALNSSVEVAGVGAYGTPTFDRLYMATGDNPYNSGEGIYIEDGGNVAIGRVTPRSLFDVYQAYGGAHYLMYHAVAGTQIKLIALGGNTGVAQIVWAATDDLGARSGGVDTLVDDGSYVNVWNSGTGVLGFMLNGSGDLYVKRTSGTRTYKVSVWAVSCEY